MLVPLVGQNDERVSSRVLQKVNMDRLTDTFLREPERPAEEELVARCRRQHEASRKEETRYVDQRHPRKRDPFDPTKHTYDIQVDIGAEDGSASFEELEEIDARQKAGRNKDASGELIAVVCRLAGAHQEIFGI